MLSLTNLLGLHSGGVFRAEAEISDGDIVQENVEVPSSLHQLLPHQQTDLAPLGDELGGVELGNNSFQDLVDNNNNNNTNTTMIVMTT